MTIPILSELCTFCVRGAIKLSPDSDSHDLIDERSHGLFSQAPDSVELEFKNFKARSAVKLGGLSEEYVVLKGVFLHGPHGTGNTSLARLCTGDASVNLFSINGAEIVTCQAVPVVVFIDELDAIVPVRKDGGLINKVTSCKLWRQVGESFKSPKTCTTISWIFRGFYEKALLDYERHKTHGGELSVPIFSLTEAHESWVMQDWHSQRLLGSGEQTVILFKAIFYDLYGDGAKVQVMADARSSDMDEAEFSRFHSGVKQDDIVGVTSFLGKTKK
ncbi:hypothetical protein VitviT2T_017125 [Vitis vinifera]|uniref:ARID domain-containing protein n=1 Tax=Vitis vinifera TaxID=29760 RepID=A0ABY9CTV0_VITVI|nr:hypothetical protein VitviT2T_017125 [Vitis vinifera]